MALSSIVGVVGGGGWLGGAIIDALLATGELQPERLIWSSRKARAERWPGARWTADNQGLADRSGIIVLSVRPADMASVNVKVEDRLVISVMAGISIAHISEALGCARVIRALPNAAAAVRQSYTPWFPSPSCTETDAQAARTIFGACGIEDRVPREQDVDYFAATTGTGSAYPALLAESLRRDAVAHGIDGAVAERAMAQLLIGTGRLLESGSKSLSELVEEYIEYRGMTAAALESMKDAGFESIVREGVSVALTKATLLRSS